MHNHHSSIVLPPSSGNKPKPTAWPAVVPASSTVKGQTAGYVTHLHTERASFSDQEIKKKKKKKKWNCTQYRWKRWGANSMCTWLVQFEVSMNCRRLSQGLHPSNEHLKANHITTSDAPSVCSFWRMLQYNSSWPHISQDSFHTRKRKKERQKMVRGVDGHSRGPGQQKSWC